MNLTKVSAVLAASVAVVLSLSACAFPLNVGAQQPEPAPTVSATPSATYDEWVVATADPKFDAPDEYFESLKTFSGMIGLDVAFEEPTMSYTDAGWVGVSQYGSLCIIALGADDQSGVDGSVMLRVLSRYDYTLTVTTSWSQDYEALRIGLEPVTKWCQTGGPLPVSPDGGDPSTTPAEPSTA